MNIAECPSCGQRYFADSEQEAMEKYKSHRCYRSLSHEELSERISSTTNTEADDPTQSTVTIGSNQWTVDVATTYAELTNGLGGVESIPAGTGMLFVLPGRQSVAVTTSAMLFNIDIVFISDGLVVDVVSNVEPGYLVTEQTPCDMFLEVNAGETTGVEVGDALTTEITEQPGTDISQIVALAIPLAVLGFVCAMAGGIINYK